MSDVAIKIEGVGKRYAVGKQKDSSLRGSLGGLLKTAASKGEDFWALKDISFEVNKGEVIGVIGKNGAGKSTLLKVLSQITKPTEGRIEINGRVASLLEVGTGFHPELTGRENIYLNGTILGMRRKEVKAKFDEIVEFSGVEKFIDTPVKHYSSGMYVRLAFAVAAHLEPEILIIDEVLAVGDDEFQKKCLGKMKDVAEKGRTVIFVSHNMAAVEKLCSKCFLLNQGELVFSGTSSETISQYLNSSNINQYFWKRDELSESKAYFNSIKVYQNNQLDITTSGKLKVEFKYEIKEELPSLNLHLALLDNYDQVIFSSAPEDSGIKKSLKKGEYTSIVEFPEDLLIPMNYSLKLILWDNIAGSFIKFDVNDGIRFKPVETKSLINNTPGGRSGIIALKCNWEITQ
jgi:lipopolysaccharide transport system ATP-binding protein